mmetsp:Transcript_12546/g.15764  ORF Transcript_12546/g.15764 Transcript_12546/m.15764 type:complete len:99 (+) Transcript_12546:177-473(+)
MASASNSACAVRSLYRALLRESKHVVDYNFRSFAMRRVAVGFDKHRNSVGDDAVVAMKEGMEQLQVLRRQRLIGELYPSAMSVLESHKRGSAGIVSRG